MKEDVELAEEKVTRRAPAAGEGRKRRGAEGLTCLPLFVVRASRAGGYQVSCLWVAF